MLPTELNSAGSEYLDGPSLCSTTILTNILCLILKNKIVWCFNDVENGVKTPHNLILKNVPSKITSNWQEKLELLEEILLSKSSVRPRMFKELQVEKSDNLKGNIDMSSIEWRFIP